MVTALNGRAAQRLFDPSISARRLSIDEVESALAKFDDVDHNALKKDLSDIFTEYTSMMESHERDVRKLRELCRREASFTAYLRRVHSSTIRWPALREAAEKGMQHIGRLDPESFSDDILVAPRGGALQAAAVLLAEVWKEGTTVVGEDASTDAARVLQRKSYLVLYQDDSGNAGIETNAHDEGELFALFVAEWRTNGTELLPYLRPLFEIACALKGYKSQVRHVTVLQAGAATHPNSRAIET